jgi:hypothetical protein
MKDASTSDVAILSHIRATSAILSFIRRPPIVCSVALQLNPKLIIEHVTAEAATSCGVLLVPTNGCNSMVDENAAPFSRGHLPFRQEMSATRRLRVVFNEIHPYGTLLRSIICHSKAGLA